MGRRSIFRFSFRSPPPPVTDTTEAPGIQIIDEVQSLSSDLEARYIPRQWAPNRLQTICVSPSERNLYLAAMAQLDTAPPTLPLWSDPAPTLPPMRQVSIMDPTPPSVLASPRGAPLRLPPAGLSSKLVMSPGMPVQGLSVREEFRSIPRVASEGTLKEHALLALSDDSQLRFHNFPVGVLMAVQEALRDAWPRGRRSAHPDLAELGRKTKEEQQDGSTWIVVLKGKVWRQSGKSELDSIRLILSLLTTLSVHGWLLVDRMQAAGVKYDNHNLLFAYSAEILAVPPTYFAVSIPLPDRISLISPPPKATPAIISAVREAIESQTTLNKRQARRKGAKGGERSPVISASRPKTGVEWDSWKGNIRLEGWVHPGVYRFWLGGMRRWLGNGVKWRIVEKLHPNLILTLINSLSAQRFTLITSLPLLPLVKGRDILIFASQQSSGLTYRDTWKPLPDAAADMSNPDSMVMVDSSDAVPALGEQIPAEVAEKVRGETAAQARLEAAGAMAEERRVALGATRPSVQTSPVRNRHMSLQAPPRRLPTQPTASNLSPEISNGLRRTGSTGSNKPVLAGTFPSSSRQPNMLIKKNSMNRREGVLAQPEARSSSLRRTQDPPSAPQRFASHDERRTEAGPLPEVVNITSRHGIGSDYSVGEGEGEWTMVEPPSQSGLSLRLYTPAQPAGGDGPSETGPGRGVASRMPPPLPARPSPPAELDAPTPHPRPTQPSMALTEASPIDGTTHQPGRSRDHTPVAATAVHALPPIPRARPILESDQSIYVGNDSLATPPPSFAPYTSPIHRPDSANEQPHMRDLRIANAAPLPLTTGGMMASFNIPLTQPTSPLKGRDALVDVGQGTGAESVRGSVGYMPSLASQSMLGLTPAISESGPILGPWDEARRSEVGGGNVPMPMPIAEPGKGEDGQEVVVDSPVGEMVRIGTARESMRNTSGLKPSKAAAMPAEISENGQDGQERGIGSARTKVSIGG